MRNLRLNKNNEKEDLIDSIAKSNMVVVVLVFDTFSIKNLLQD